MLFKEPVINLLVLLHLFSNVLLQCSDIIHRPIHWLFFKSPVYFTAKALQEVSRLIQIRIFVKADQDQDLSDPGSAPIQSSPSSDQAGSSFFSVRVSGEDLRKDSLAVGLKRIFEFRISAGLKVMYQTKA